MWDYFLFIGHHSGLQETWKKVTEVRGKLLAVSCQLLVIQ